MAKAYALRPDLRLPLAPLIAETKGSTTPQPSVQ
jgi:hypothetical protein